VVSQQRLRAPRTGPPLHGVPTWFFFHRGKRPAGRPAGMALGQFEAAVAAAREKIRAAGNESDAGVSEIRTAGAGD